MLNKKYFNIINNNTFSLDVIENNNTIFFSNNKKLFEKLNKYKRLINKIELKNWNNIKKFTYNYEYVYNNNSYDYSLVKYKPISRSYYKLCELITDQIKLENKKIKFCFLAECPGGFIDYIINSRKHLFVKDEYYTISLISNNKSIPNFYLLNQKYENIKMLKGKDNTGNICNIDNILYLKDNIKVDFVTADGGFDFTENYDDQEKKISNLIFCEIISAFSILNKDGTFILKVFDLYSSLSFNYIYLLSLYFNEVLITKPFISKPANSEKYIICKNFKSIKEDELKYFYNLIKNKKIINIKLPKTYIDYLTQINIYYTILQINNIILSVYLYENNIIKYNYNYKLFIYFKQFIYSILWCIKYNQLINFKIMFFSINYKKKIEKILFNS